MAEWKEEVRGEIAREKEEARRQVRVVEVRTAQAEARAAAAAAEEGAREDGGWGKWGTWPGDGG